MEGGPLEDVISTSPVITAHYGTGRSLSYSSGTQLVNHTNISCQVPWLIDIDTDKISTTGNLAVKSVLGQ